ncbi:MAG TPA: hypothetical protein PLV68_10210, partial [Ilumatobacteraceae bacterium]|nr:hypothetical protein [Ilumatobacteraceae bacterium]
PLPAVLIGAVRQDQTVVASLGWRTRLVRWSSTWAGVTEVPISLPRRITVTGPSSLTTTTVAAGSSTL